jgi:organic hydroperoxide reductase OsmC/OhrA
MSGAGRVHQYRCRLEWSGSTAEGHERFGRGHRVVCGPSPSELRLSADAAFRGDPRFLNPEQLLLAAASSCQCLSFLAVAARARIDVVAYADAAEALMPEDDAPVRITRIVLRPRIVVAGEVSEARVRRLVDLAHRECYVANSLRTEMCIEPLIERRARG